MPVFSSNQASHGNAKGTIRMQNWMLYSTLRSEWGQLGKKKKKKNEKKDFFSIYHYHPVTVPTNIACFLVEPKRLTEMPRTPLDAELNALFNPAVGMRTAWQEKKKKKWKKRFFQHYIASTSHLKIPTNIACFLVEPKRLTEMPRAPLDAELNALFNHGVRMRTAWQQKKQKRKKILSAFISSTQSHFPRILPVFWLNKASHRNAKGTNGCRIECSIQPCVSEWGQAWE